MPAFNQMQGPYSMQEMMGMGLTPDAIQKAYFGVGKDPGNQFVAPPGTANRMPTSQEPAQQTSETREQALAGNSQNAEAPPPMDQPLDNPNAINPYLLANIAQGGITPESRKPIEENIAESKKGLEKFLEYQNALKAAPMQTDLSPLLALSDSLTGSKLAGSYAKPQTGEERIGQLAKLQGMSQDEREKLTNSLITLAKGNNMQRLQSSLLTNDRQQKAAASKIIGAVTSDKLISAFDTQGAALDKGLAIMDEIKKGTRVWDDNTKNELESDFASALQGSRAIGLGASERQTFNPYDARFAKLQGELKGHKINFEDPNAEKSYLSQLRQNFSGLNDTVSQQKSTRANGLLDFHTQAQSGNPYAANTIKSIRGRYQYKKPQAEEVSPQMEQPPPGATLRRKKPDGSWEYK